MKSNASCDNGGSLLPADYASYATWQVNYIKSVQTYAGITPYAISVQNEPDQTQPYDSATWTAAEIESYILNNLGPAITAAGLPTLIMMPESSNPNRLTTYANTCMTTPACASYVGIIADHGYDDSQVSYTTGITNQHLWQTEDGPIGTAAQTFDPSIATAVNTYAKNIHSDLTLGWSAWCWWAWASGNPGQQLIDAYVTGDVSKTLWVMGQWSRFVRPGWVRIDSTANPQTGVYITAFKSPSGGSYSIVAVNTNSSATSQTFTFSGFPNATSITPWVTSSTLDLAAQPSVAVEGNSFSFSLPEESVTTFVGTTSGKSASSPVGPPSGLSVSVK
jgi:glucuronoarabinoxylan endo-1,4-beta-xylanase